MPPTSTTCPRTPKRKLTPSASTWRTSCCFNPHPLVGAGAMWADYARQRPLPRLFGFVSTLTRLWGRMHHQYTLRDTRFLPVLACSATDAHRPQNQRAGACRQARRTAAGRVHHPRSQRSRRSQTRETHPRRAGQSPLQRALRQPQLCGPQTQTAHLYRQTPRRLQAGGRATAGGEEPQVAAGRLCEVHSLRRVAD
jgi:hypothetical protein